MKFENKNVIVTIQDGELSVRDTSANFYEFGTPISGKPDSPEIILALAEEMTKLVKRGERVNTELEQLKSSIQLLHNQL